MTTTTTTATRTTSSGTAFDRALPHDLDAERAVLGSMLLEETAIAEAISVLNQVEGEPFFWPKHQKLYEHIVELWKANRPLDGVVIKDELVRRGAFEELGGYEFLADLIASVPTALHVREYAGIVRDKLLLRRLIGAAHHVMDEAFNDAQPAREILDLAASEIFRVTEAGLSDGAVPLPQLVEEFFRKLEKLDGKILTGEPTGYYELDDLTCGLQPSELIIIAGRPSMGKTTLGLNLAEHLALTVGRPVVFFSLEMSREQVAQRILCSRARVDSQKLRRGRHSRQDLERLQRIAGEIETRPLFIDDTSSLTITELRARARMAHRKHRICAVFVDYLQLLRCPEAARRDNRQQEVAEISRGLKALAKDLNVPVVAMAQLNRGPEDRSGNRPRMSDLRESGAIEQDADVVGLLHRESYYKRSELGATDDDSSAELIIAKQRNGPVDTIKLHYNAALTRFDNPDVGGRYENERGAYYTPPDFDPG